MHLGDDGKTFFARAAGFDLRHREEEALQKVDAERQHGAYLVRGLKALGHDLHAALVCVGHGVRHDLALVGVGVDAADDGKVDLDVVGRELEKAALVAVAAAVIIQREGAAADRLLDAQRLGVEALFLRDLNDDARQDRGVARGVFRKLIGR